MRTAYAIMLHLGFRRGCEFSLSLQQHEGLSKYCSSRRLFSQFLRDIHVPGCSADHCGLAIHMSVSSYSMKVSAKVSGTANQTKAPPYHPQPTYLSAIPMIQIPSALALPFARKRSQWIFRLVYMRSLDQKSSAYVRSVPNQGHANAHTRISLFRAAHQVF